VLRLTSNDGMAIFHLARKALKKIPLYEEKDADMVNVPFYDENLNKVRYLTFWRRRGDDFKKKGHDWGYTGVEDEPVPTRL